MWFARQWTRRIERNLDFTAPEKATRGHRIRMHSISRDFDFKTDPDRVTGQLLFVEKAWIVQYYCTRISSGVSEFVRMRNPDLSGKSECEMRRNPGNHIGDFLHMKKRHAAHRIRICSNRRYFKRRIEKKDCIAPEKATYPAQDPDFACS